MTNKKGIFCPFMVSGGNMHINGFCKGEDCSWWCKQAKSCSVPLIAKMCLKKEAKSNDR